MSETKIDEELPALQGEQLEAYREIVNNRQKNFFIQGQAGTGKSTLIKHLRKTYERDGTKVALVAPTGIAAELIGGSTIHSLFWLGGDDFFKKNLEDINPVLRTLSTLIIDEVSMVRADILDVIDDLCRKAKENTSTAFGGIQIILVGDLHQIAPIVKREAENDNLNKYGIGHPFFFDARCYEVGEFNMITLKRIYRQSSDVKFLENLESICSANEQRIEKALNSLNERVISPPEEGNIPTVTYTKKEAKIRNDEKLAQLEGGDFIFKGVIEGKFDPDKDSLSPLELRLKVGAKVMFCRNDTQNGQYVNGTMGVVTDLHNDPGRQSISVATQRGETVVLKERATWEKHEYKEVGGELKHEVIGSFMQFPLMLAYAITIHKSQGQTWNNVNIILKNKPTFTHGLIYVALSRVKTQDSIYLNRRLKSEDVILDRRVQQFLVTGKRPQVKERQTEHASLVDRADKNSMKEFWRAHCDANANIVYSKLVSTYNISPRRRFHICFWSTLPFEWLKEPLNLIYCVDETSYLFKIPANDIKENQVAAKKNIYTQRSRQSFQDGDLTYSVDRYFEWDTYKKVFFDLFVECGGEFTELHRGAVRFKKYLVASETRGVVTLYDNNDDVL